MLSLYIKTGIIGSKKYLFKSIAQAGEPSIANFQQKIMCGFKKIFLASNLYGNKKTAEK